MCLPGAREDDPRLEVKMDVGRPGRALPSRGDPAGAQTYYGRVLRHAEATHGPEHPTVATCLNSPGVVVGDHGDLAAARACFERALRIDKAVHGRDYATTQVVRARHERACTQSGAQRR